MFATRTSWTARPGALDRTVAEIRAGGGTIVDLTCTNPTRHGFACPAGALLRELARPEALIYNPTARGLPAARAAVAGYYRSRGVHLPAQRLLLCSGTSEAYSFIFRLLANPGDRILVPSPSYPLLDSLADLCDVGLAPYPLAYDGRWWIDLEALRGAIDDACRAIVVISPNNPTGSFIRADELTALRRLAAERGLALIVDEVFADYAIGDDARAPDPLGGGEVLTFVLNGISKMLALPQMKLAWIAVGGPPADADRALERLETIADTYLSVGAPVQLALPQWLALRAVIQPPIRSRLQANAAALRTLRHASALHTEAGWSAVLRIPRTLDDEALALALLQRHGILIDPGRLYGFGDAGHAVVSLLPAPEVFRDAVGRLDELAGSLLA